MMEPDHITDRAFIALNVFGALMAHHNPGVQHEPAKIAATARFAFVAADIFLAETKSQAEKLTA